MLYPSNSLHSHAQQHCALMCKIQQCLALAFRDDGVGLAAPQVGVNVRMMVYNQEGKRGEGQEYILVNPKIVSTSKSTDVMEEGCLSFQDIGKDLHIKGEVTVSIQFTLQLLTLF